MPNKRRTGEGPACTLLDRASKYVSKGLEMGAYTETVGGDLFAERLLKNIDGYMQRSCTIRRRRQARARAPSY